MITVLYLISERLEYVINQHLSNKISVELFENCINLEQVINHQLKKLNIESWFERECVSRVNILNDMAINTIKSE